MAKLFPFRPESQHESAGPRLVNMDDEVADDVFAALSSDTAREILSQLYEDPATASDVAEGADTSLQNARYHLDKLESAGLIEAVDTWYSSRGTEMTVYAPTNEPLVVAAGREESKGVLRSALERVVGAVTVLAFASVVVDQLVRRFGGPTAMFSAGGEGAGPAGADGSANLSRTITPAETVAAEGGAKTVEEAETVASTSTETALEAESGTVTDAPAGTPTPPGTETGTAVYEATQETSAPETVMETPSPSPESTQTAEGTAETVAGEAPGTVARQAAETATNTSTSVPETVADGGVDLLSSMPPGGLFFAGGLLVVVLVSAWWYWGQYRPMYG
ncbi:MAG: helix-turn-helix domain-containing protein [Halobacteriales archaeon]